MTFVGQAARRMGLAMSRGQVTVAAALVGMVGLLWAPIVGHQGVVFARDPSFYATVHGDISWSLGAFTLQGGVANIPSQGIFYEPYAIAEWLLHSLGLNSGEISKAFPIVLSLVAVSGAYRLLREQSIGSVASLVAASFYLLNPWSLDEFGYFFIWTGYCMLPWLVIGTARIWEDRRCPLWYPFAILFLGAVTAWVAGVLAITLTAVFYAAKSDRLGRKVARTSAIFVATGAFWIVPYIAFAAAPSGQSLSYSSGGGILLSAHPIVSLFELRDFWWPHLNIVSLTGSVENDIGLIATALIVACTTIWLVLAWRMRGPFASRTRFRGLLVVLTVVGVLLAVGSAGPTGRAYTFVRNLQFFAHPLIGSLLRSPSNLALFMVAAVSLALGGFVDVLSQWLAGEPAVHGSHRGRRISGAAIGAIVLVGACGPSVVAFWDTYRPIVVPAYYQQAQGLVPRGTTLEIGDWNTNAISPATGVWNFVWNRRMVADPTVLASFIIEPSISPNTTAVNALGNSLIAEVDAAGSVKPIERVAREIGLTSVVVEHDIQRPASDIALQKFIQILNNGGFRVNTVGGLTVFSLPLPFRTPLWDSSCKVSTNLLSVGLVRVTCPTNGSSTITSPFNFPGPILGQGLSLGHVAPVSHDVGTRIRVVHGKSGWIVFVPALMATIGLGITSLWVLYVLARSLWIAGIRRIRRSDA